MERGIINPDNDGKYQRVVRLPGMGPRRSYEIDASLLFGDDDEPSAQVNGALGCRSGKISRRRINRAIAFPM